MKLVEWYIFQVGQLVSEFTVVTGRKGMWGLAVAVAVADPSKFEFQNQSLAIAIHAGYVKLILRESTGR